MKFYNQRIDEMKEIAVAELKENFIETIGKEWMLVTAGPLGACNTMTASWGSIGWLWNKPVAFVFIRPERYTHEFIEKYNRLTLSFLGEEHKKVHAICGSKSGREVDKIEATGLTPVGGQNDTVLFEESRLSLVCRKMYADSIKPECFLEPGFIERWYESHGGYHEMYILEIEQVLVR